MKAIILIGLVPLLAAPAFGQSTDHSMHDMPGMDMPAQPEAEKPEGTSASEPGHDMSSMPETPAPDVHAGHDMPAPPADEHAGHDMSSMGSMPAEGTDQQAGQEPPPPAPTGPGRGPRPAAPSTGHHRAADHRPPM